MWLGAESNRLLFDSFKILILYRVGVVNGKVDSPLFHFLPEIKLYIKLTFSFS